MKTTINIATATAVSALGGLTAIEPMTGFDDALHEVPVTVANAMVVVVPCHLQRGEAAESQEAHLVVARRDCRGERVRGAALRRLAHELAHGRGADAVLVEVDGQALRLA